MQTKGLSFPEFSEVFDRAKTDLVLAPAVEIELPRYMKWSRQRIAINECSSSSMTWLQKIGTKALAECGIVDAENEQQTFLAEFLASRLKLPEFKACVKALVNLFNIDAVPLLLEHFVLDLVEFVCCMQQMFRMFEMFEMFEM